MTVARATPLVAPDRATPHPADAFAAAIALRRFTGNVSTDQLWEMLRGSGTDSRWLAGARWSLLERMWLQRVDEATATSIIVSYDAEA